LDDFSVGDTLTQSERAINTDVVTPAMGGRRVSPRVLRVGAVEGNVVGNALLSTAPRLTHSFERVLCVRFSRDANTPGNYPCITFFLRQVNMASFAHGQRVDLVSLLAPLQSQDNVVRNQAEEVYQNMVKNDGLNLMTQTTQILVQSPDEGTQEFAALLLRRQLARWGSLSNTTPELLATIKTQLVQCLDPARSKKLRSKAVNCIVALCNALCEPPELTEDQEIDLRQYCADQDYGEAETEDYLQEKIEEMAKQIEEVWPELLPTVIQLAQDANPVCRETGHLILADVAMAIEKTMVTNGSQFAQLFQSGLGDSVADVRKAALNSACCFLSILRPENLGNAEVAVYQQLTPGLVAALTSMLNGSNIDDDAVESAIQNMEMIASSFPQYWRPNLDAMLRLMMNVIGADSLENGPRQSAVEFVIALAESASGMMRKCKGQLNEFIGALLKICADIGDSEFSEWAVEQNEESFGDGCEEDEFAEVGEQAFDRLARAIGGKVLFPLLMPLAEQALSSQDWKMRRSGLTAIALTAEGCKKAILPNIAQLTRGIMGFFGDPHHRVRYAAIHCVGQFATDFPGSFQKKAGSAVVPALVQAVSDTSSAERLRCCAAKSIQAFSDGGACKAALLTPHLQQLLEAMFQLIEIGTIATKENCLTAVSSISTVVEDAFEPYYDHFMPLLIKVLQIEATEENATLRGRAIECIGFLGGSVQRAKFDPYVQPIMEGLVAMLNQGNSPTNVDREYVMQGCVRICEALKQDFAPYMQHVLPHIFKALTAKEVRAGEDDDGGKVDDGMTEVSTTLGQVIGINTAAIQEKVAATDTLLQFIIFLDEAFLPYANDSYMALCPCVAHAIIPQVRSSSAAAMPSLLRLTVSALKANNQPMATGQELFCTMLDLLLDATKKETDEDTRGTLAQAMCEVSQIAYESGGDNETTRTGFNTPVIGVKAQDLPKFMGAVIPLLKESVKRRTRAFTKAEKNVDYDAEAQEEIEALTRQEFQFCVSLIEVIGCMIKSHGPSFLPYFETILAPFVNELMTNQIPSVRQAGVCFIDDIVEFGGPEAAKYIPVVVDHLLVASSDNDNQLRQAAVYGIGIFTEFGGAAFEPYVQKSLEVLVQGTQHWIAKTAEDPSHYMATNNSISAIMKLTRQYPQIAQPQQCWPLVMSWLPLNVRQGDLLEAQVVHKVFVEELAQNNVHLMGQNFANLSQVVAILGGILVGPNSGDEELEDYYEEYADDDDVELFDEKTKGAMKQLFLSLGQNCGPQLLAIVNQLPPAYQESIKKLCA
jgi:importin-5